MKPLSWLSVKWALELPTMFESNQTWYIKKRSTAIHRMCRQVGWYVLLLGPATIKTHVYAGDFHQWHFTWHIKSWTATIGQMKAIFILGTFVWQQSNMYNKECFVSKHRLVTKNFMQCGEKSIFCMQHVCKVHCKYGVAHAYNMVAKIQSSSGWAFLGCAALSATHKGFWKCTCERLLRR